jgi:hypothetical protein
MSVPGAPIRAMPDDLERLSAVQAAELLDQVRAELPVVGGLGLMLGAILRPCRSMAAADVSGEQVAGERSRSIRRPRRRAGLACSRRSYEPLFLTMASAARLVWAVHAR